MTDKLVRAVTKNGNFRAISVDATQMMNQVAKYHDASTLAITILGRALLGGLLLANALLKDRERLAMTIDGGGPAGKIVVETSAEGQVRGYVTNPQVTLPKKADGSEDVAAAVGTNGYLTVTKEMGEDTEPFTGKVQLATGEIGDDITYYMAKSEQIPSAVAVSVDINDDHTIKAAGGFMVSTLPDATDEELAALESRLESFPSIASILEREHEPLALLNKLFGKDQIKALSSTDVTLYPELTKAQYARMLKTLPLEQLKEMLADDHGVQVEDRFTGKQIRFDQAELRSIIKSVEEQHD